LPPKVERATWGLLRACDDDVPLCVAGVHLSWCLRCCCCCAKLSEACGRGRPIVPVGTTSVRTLESLYHWGAALARGQGHGSSSVADMRLGQWDPYRAAAAGAPGGVVPAKEALVRGPVGVWS
jgi:hypothetical protein